MASLLERLLSHSIPEPNSGCWLWMGSVNQKGYGRFSYRNRLVQAHRISYELHTGRPAGEQIDHLCRVKCCINPDHLEPVTPKENVRRSWAARGKRTHCKRGHLITQWRKSTSTRQGEAVCNACKNINNRRPENKLKRRLRYEAGRQRIAKEMNS